MILLWGLSGDGPLEEVRRSLQERGATFALLDQRDILATEIEINVGETLTGIIRTPQTVIDLGEVTAVYMRVYDSRELSSVSRAGEASAEWAHALAVESALYSWIELTDALVVNRPSAMASNNSKPFQAAIIEAHGFKTPTTLITTEPSALRDFRDTHSRVIYKSVSGVRSIVSMLTGAHLERLDDVVWCPTQFQQYVEGTDYRVHVIGGELFPCEVISEAYDYRYARQQGASLELCPRELPLEVATRTRALVAAMGLAVAGVDLRRTPNDEWFCFEVNPSPGFTFYEPEDERPLADAIAHLLMGVRHEVDRLAS
jgi:hypothetical protein